MRVPHLHAAREGGGEGESSLPNAASVCASLPAAASRSSTGTEQAAGTAGCDDLAACCQARGCVCPAPTPLLTARFRYAGGCTCSGSSHVTSSTAGCTCAARGAGAVRRARLHCVVRLLPGSSMCARARCTTTRAPRLAPLPSEWQPRGHPARALRAPDRYRIRPSLVPSHPYRLASCAAAACPSPPPHRGHQLLLAGPRAYEVVLSDLQQQQQQAGRRATKERGGSGHRRTGWQWRPWAVHWQWCTVLQLTSSSDAQTRSTRHSRQIGTQPHLAEGGLRGEAALQRQLGAQAQVVRPQQGKACRVDSAVGALQQQEATPAA